MSNYFCNFAVEKVMKQSVSRYIGLARALTVALVLMLSVAQGLAQGQVRIDGRLACLDSQNMTMLATIPQSAFGQSPTLLVEYQWPWVSCTIDGVNVIREYQFADIQAQHYYQMRLTDAFGVTSERRLTFTFLPILQLQGDFDNDYHVATLLLTNPDNTYTDRLTGRAKWRGGTTNTPDKHKRNYKVKLDSDTTLLGMRKDDSWILDAGQPDVFRLRNRIAMDLWNDMAPPTYYADEDPRARSGVSGRVVEVFVNDEYRGIYNFSEPIDRKQMRLKKLDTKTGQIRGCLYKGVNWDRTQGFDYLEGYNNLSDTYRGFEMKYPDLNDNDTTDWAPLIEAYNFAQSSTDEELAAHIEEYFDLKPMLYYSLFVSVVNALDNSGKNMYWAVYDKTADRRLTPAAWDLDCTFGQRWGGRLVESKYHQPSTLTDVDVCAFYRLYKSNYNGFNDELNRVYSELRQPGQVFATDSLISRFRYYYEMLRKSGAAQRETDLWSGDSDVWGDTIDFNAEYNYIRDWITRHMRLLDRHTFPVYYNYDFFNPKGVDSPTAERNKQNGIYNLNGQRLTDSGTRSPGIYIINGRKTVIR